MLEISESVDIAATPETVFVVVSDVPRRAQLNPNIEVIRVEQESDGPVGKGTIFYSRIQKGQRILAYRIRFTKFQPCRKIEYISDTDPPFKVKISLKKTRHGTRLIQKEEMEITPQMVMASESKEDGSPFKASQEFGELLLMTEPISEYMTMRDAYLKKMEHSLKKELRAWLIKIKEYIERGGLQKT